MAVARADGGEISCFGNITPLFYEPPGSTLWMVGSNNLGELGVGDTADRSSLVQVGSLTGWSNISYGYYTLALRG